MSQLYDSDSTITDFRTRDCCCITENATSWDYSMNTSGYVTCNSGECWLYTSGNFRDEGGQGSYNKTLPFFPTFKVNLAKIDWEEVIENW